MADYTGVPPKELGVLLGANNEVEGGRIPPIIGTREELGLPTGWHPTLQEGERLEDVPLSRWLGEALGHASVCWTERPSGVFDSTAAGSILDSLHAHVQSVIDGVIEGEREHSLLGAHPRHLLQVLGERLADHPASDYVNELGKLTDEELAGEAVSTGREKAVRAAMRGEGGVLGETTTRELLEELRLRGDLAMTVMPTSDRGADGAALSALAGALMKSSCLATLEAVRGT